MERVINAGIKPTSVAELLDRDAYKARFGIGESTLCKWIRIGLSPAPMRIGRKTYWLERNVEEAFRRLGLKAQGKSWR